MYEDGIDPSEQNYYKSERYFQITIDLFKKCTEFEKKELNPDDFLIYLEKKCTQIHDNIKFYDDPIFIEFYELPIITSGFVMGWKNFEFF